MTVKKIKNALGFYFTSLTILYNNKNKYCEELQII